MYIYMCHDLSTRRPENAEVYLWNFISMGLRDGFIKDACRLTFKVAVDLLVRYFPAFDKAHNDVIKWKYFPLYWPFVRGIHQSPVNSPHKGQ